MVQLESFLHLVGRSLSAEPLMRNLMARSESGLKLPIQMNGYGGAMTPEIASADHDGQSYRRDSLFSG